jgi:formylglycine-generating enzyme required for sulfatase activity
MRVAPEKRPQSVAEVRRILGLRDQTVWQAPPRRRWIAAVFVLAAIGAGAANFGTLRDLAEAGVSRIEDILSPPRPLLPRPRSIDLSALQGTLEACNQSLKNWDLEGAERNLKAAESILETMRYLEPVRIADCSDRIKDAKQHGFQEPNCKFCPRMRVILPKPFDMGSPPREPGRTGVEHPPHRVSIPRRYAVGIYEVTIREYKECVERGVCKTSQSLSEAETNLPMVRVSWEQAQKYVKWLSEKTLKQYRLLTEAEWEYAARAGTVTAFSVGPLIFPEQANYNWKYKYPEGFDRMDSLGKPVRVGGSGEANGLGLYDMHGNVSEWVEDCWHKDYYGAPKDGSAWLSGGNCEERVIRGGSFREEPVHIRSASRHKVPKEHYDETIGFRVARDFESLGQKAPSSGPNEK